MYEITKFKWISMLLLICILTTCQVKKPIDPSGPAKLSVNLKISDGTEQNGLIERIRPMGQSKALTSMTPLSPESIEDIQIVFYHFDMNIEELIESYEESETELEDLLEEWGQELDIYDFESYWIGFTKALFDIVAPGKYMIEKQDQLEIDGHHATGEFEVADGTKYILVGLTGAERLEYVGESYELYDPDMQGYSTFFELEPGQEKQVNITLYYLFNSYDWY